MAIELGYAIVITLGTFELQYNRLYTLVVLSDLKVKVEHTIKHFEIIIENIIITKINCWVSVDPMTNQECYTTDKF